LVTGDSKQLRFSDEAQYDFENEMATFHTLRQTAAQAPPSGLLPQIEELQNKNQMKTTKTLIASAAVAGLMAGSLPVRAYAASAPTQAGVSLQTLADKGTHACKGQNACKGQGGCKTSDAGCKGKNSCKGKGGCATDGSKAK
jgi:hypothetical protein